MTRRVTIFILFVTVFFIASCSPSAVQFKLKSIKSIQVKNNHLIHIKYIKDERYHPWSAGVICSYTKIYPRNIIPWIRKNILIINRYACDKKTSSIIYAKPIHLAIRLKNLYATCEPGDGGTRSDMVISVQYFSKNKLVLSRIYRGEINQWSFAPSVAGESSTLDRVFAKILSDIHKDVCQLHASFTFHHPAI